MTQRDLGTYFVPPLRRAVSVVCLLGCAVACVTEDEPEGDDESTDVGDSGDPGSGGAGAGDSGSGSTQNGSGGSGASDPLGTGGGNVEGSGGAATDPEAAGGTTEHSGGTGSVAGSGGNTTQMGERALGSSTDEGTGCSADQVVDACGICDGDGSSCDCYEGDICADIIFEHNEVRRLVNLGQFAEQPAADPPIAMVGWDPLIAAKAQEWADTLEDWSEGHSSNQFRTYQSTHHNGYHGENMAIGGGEYAEPHAFVYTGWSLDEAQGCELSTCGGHYTQVVWRESQWVGCGRKDEVPFEVDGQTYSGTLTVCEYAPGGNSGGDPY